MRLPPSPSTVARRSVTYSCTCRGTHEVSIAKEHCKILGLFYKRALQNIRSPLQRSSPGRSASYSVIRTQTHKESPKKSTVTRVRQGDISGLSCERALPKIRSLLRKSPPRRSASYSFTYAHTYVHMRVRAHTHTHIHTCIQ